MNHACNLLCKALLQRAHTRVFSLLGHKGFNLLTRKLGKNLYIAFGIGIAHIKPELIELIRRSILRIKPYVS